MDNKLTIDVRSEIGELEGVILHEPGREVENMTPENASRALYDDILNLSVASQEYNEFQGVLKKATRTFELKDLLLDIIKNDKVKENLVARICKQDATHDIQAEMMALSNEEICRQILEGVEMKKDNLTRFLDNNRYSLEPLPNFFFMRDASASWLDKVLICNMASKVRARETMIMEAIFDYHPVFETSTINPARRSEEPSLATIEGGDFLVAREDVLLIGTGPRTSSQGIDSILAYLKAHKMDMTIIAQQLPSKPESFIHLDMVFTFLDRDKCMIYEPLILNNYKFQTIKITVKGGRVEEIKEIPNILEGLKPLGIDLEPISCGGTSDSYFKEREQWQSGANFFAMGPGKIIGYGRNTHTIEQLDKHGFNVLDAKDVISDKVSLNDYNKYIVTFGGSELSRGGGGARCMTMPLRRKSVNW
ncbi:MAG: arginine deiminase family protein [Hyphomicrobiales bacterium]